jgi:hypothetical protein
VIKEKKHAVSQADLNLKSLEHAIQVLGKEKTTAMHFVTNLEKMYDWIAEESEYVCFLRIEGLLIDECGCGVANLGSLGQCTILRVRILGS